MSVYLGTLGRLVELKCPSSQPVAVDDGTTFDRSLEGVVTAQVRALRRRQWDIRIGLGTPADLANVLAFSAGEFGNGPFTWVSADAPVTNLLTPDVSTCGSTSDIGSTVEVGGPMNLPDGTFAGRSLTNSDTTKNINFGTATTPVLPGEPVTASAYLTGAGCKMGINFVDSAGAFISSVLSTASGTAGSATRLSVTVDGTAVPLNAAACQVFGSASTQGARPAVTWTDRMFDWQPGEGCPKAILSGVSRDLLLALREPTYGRYSALSCLITELG